ncbi:MAG: response regulator [Bacteroidota bacterium]|nr:response regulator [Bacteroidota bacterium]
MNQGQKSIPLTIVLADDDSDDCTFFKEALRDFSLPTHLTIVEDGEKLMTLLTDVTKKLPDVIFLDLNMPRKNGFECLADIKESERLMHLPVIIYSTSFHRKIANMLHDKGANYYISKPSEISALKEAVRKMVTLISEGKFLHPTKETFLLTAERKNSKTFLWFNDFFIIPGEESVN